LVPPADEEVGKEDIELEAVVRQSETRHQSGSDGNSSAAGTAMSGPAKGSAAGGAYGGEASSSGSHIARPNRSASAALDQPLLSYDVTLVSQTSDDRVWMISHLAKRWGGPISIAIFVTDEVLVRNERRWLNRIANQPGSYITEVHSKGASGYPVNFLRNTAIDRVRTSHYFLTDIDLWPSTFSYNAVLSQGEALLGNPHAALVLPAFEYSAPNRSRDELDAGREAIARALPDTFEGLRDCAGGIDGPCRYSSRWQWDCGTGFGMPCVDRQVMRREVCPAPGTGRTRYSVAENPAGCNLAL
jgi:glycosyltransferase-like protein LARGE